MADCFTKLIQISQKIEQLLEKNYHAQGRGLHEKLTSVANEIPQDIQRKIRFIATIRNQATHEDINIAKEKLADVRKAYQVVLPAIDRGASRRMVLFRKTMIIIALIAFTALYFLFFR